MSPKTNTLTDGLINRTLDEIKSKTVHNDRVGDWYECSKANQKHRYESREFSKDKSCTKESPSFK